MNKKVGLLILDGIGVNKEKKGNAFFFAKTPTIDKLLKTCPHCLLEASGPYVGLPKKQMGNSEVGHFTIGMGRTILTQLEKINHDIEDKNFFKNKILHDIIVNNNKTNSKLHIMGLFSNGGVHSHLSHIDALLEFCINNKIRTVLHCFSDGRDVGTNEFYKDLEHIIKKIIKYPFIQIGTIAGRYYAMDRDQRWDRVQSTIDAIMHTNRANSFSDPLAYVKSQYDKKIFDEFIQPAFNTKASKTTLEKNDWCFFINFRPDRARQICHLLKKSNLYQVKSSLWDLNLFLITMCNYDRIAANAIFYPPQKITNTLGEIIASNNIKQLRIAETEKYAHVTFFLDGGKEFNYPNEEKILIPSPKVVTYDLKPEMSAYEITDTLIKNMDKFGFFVCNFANGDMVGHTGKMQPTIKAIETVDKCLEMIVKKAQEANYTLFITADHGNCDVMLDKNNQVCTTHSLNPVFFISTDTTLHLENGSLANIAPTILKYFKIKIPKEMAKPLF